MTRAFASLLLRSYPRTWRMRYEEEVRALLEDRAPGWRDVAGLLRGAGREWLHGIVDPVEHPILASVVTGLAGWWFAAVVISLTAEVGTEVLSRTLGAPPAWIGTVSAFALVAAWVRGAAGQFRFGPLSASQMRRWWIILWAAVVLGRWAGDVLVSSQWWIAPLLFTSGTDAAWRRQRAQAELIRLRKELHVAAREHMRLRGLLPIYLSTSPELEQVTAEVARLNREARAAAEVWRQSRPFSITASEQR